MPQKIIQFFDTSAEKDILSNRYNSKEFLYTALDFDNPESAIAAVEAKAPKKMDGMTLVAVGVRQNFDGRNYRIFCKYQYQTRTTLPDDYRPSVNFDTIGGTKHITNSIATVASYPANAPDFKGAINFDGKSVAGLDIVMPVFNFSVAGKFYPDEINMAYYRILLDLTGAVNVADFYGFSAGELLFLGATGSRTGTGENDLWDVTFKFSGSPNRRSFNVAGYNIMFKKGWDFLWIKWRNSLNDTQVNLVPVAETIKIEQVYEYKDFTALGI